MRFPLALMTAVVALVAAMACTDSRSGTPRPAPDAGMTSTTTTVSDPRPRPVELAGVDPCKLLSDQQLAHFGVLGSLLPGEARPPSVLVGAPGCTASSFELQYGYLVIASSELGLPEYLSQVRGNPTRHHISVDGFPAVEEEGLASEPESGSGECYVNVDVADGQLLQVQFSQIGADPDRRLAIEALCAKAREVAEAALTTLQGG